MHSMMLESPLARRAGVQGGQTAMSCGQWVDDEGTRCGLPAEILDRYTVESTTGQDEHVKTRCVDRHRLNCSVDCLA